MRFILSLNILSALLDYFDASDKIVLWRDQRSKTIALEYKHGDVGFLLACQTKGKQKKLERSKEQKIRLYLHEGRLQCSLFRI